MVLVPVGLHVEGDGDCLCVSSVAGGDRRKPIWVFIRDKYESQCIDRGQGLTEEEGSEETDLSRG